MITVTNEKTEIGQKSIPELYSDLITLEPKPIACFVPSNATEQKEAFLKGTIRNPDHSYDKLANIDYNSRQAEIEAFGVELGAHQEQNPKFRTVYEEFAENYQRKTRLMELAHLIKTTEDEMDKERYSAEYMRLNIEVYGEPDETTFRSLLSEKLHGIATKNLSGTAAQLRDELFAMVNFNETAEAVERFRPSEETMSWMRGVVETLYGGMLSHVPEQEEFTVAETQAIFQRIIDQEFGDAATSWKVDVEPAKAINVKSTEKRIVIPEDRGVLTREALRKMVVHEIGVHMLRAIMGEATDLYPLQNGLNEYYEAEEGLGTVMEQALTGTFREAGVDHYITAGLTYFEGKDFRDVFEVKWRLNVLAGLADGDITDEVIEKAKSTAYGGVMRILRGTDELPWFKDLAYYNGAVNVWRHLEAIRGDDARFMFVLLGKADASNKMHERVMYETSTV